MSSATVISCAAEINRLHEEARQHVVASKRSLHAALTAAWRAGQLLLAEKRRVRQTMGPGAWLFWLEQNFRGTPRTAQRYMKLAQSVTDIAFVQGMSLRQAYDRLGVPMEEKSPSQTFPLQTLAAHVVLVNKLVRALPSPAKLGALPPARRAAFREDLSPLYRRMRPLFEATEALPANSDARVRSEES